MPALYGDHCTKVTLYSDSNTYSHVCTCTCTYMHVHVYMNLMHYGVRLYMNEPNISLYLGVSIIVYHVSTSTSTGIIYNHEYN